MRTILLAVLLAACGGSSKPAPAPAPANEVTEEPTPPAPVDVRTSTGSAACDELIARTLCFNDKVGDAIPVEAKLAFEDSVRSWREALSNDATKQATIDACVMSLRDQGDGFAAIAC